jgi:hypothetical protein
MIVTNDVNAAHWAVENGLLLEFAQAHALILKQNRVSLRTVAPFDEGGKSAARCRREVVNQEVFAWLVQDG